MSEQLKNELSEVEILSSLLLATLDEEVFFNEVTKFFKRKFKASRVKLFLSTNKEKMELLSLDGARPKKQIIFEKGEGSCGYVARTKKAYISNNVARDPIFQSFQTQIESELTAEMIIPILCDSVLLGSLHFQSLGDDNISFGKKDIDNIIMSLEKLEKPLKNMKMYLQAKILNQALLEKIEEAEKELAQQKLGLQFAETYKVEDRELLGNSECIARLKQLVEKVSQSDVDVLIKGEIGTGKELIAKKIHLKSQRKKGPFACIDCSSLPEDQLESEVFGEEAGSQQLEENRQGLLEILDGGTLYLKNISSLSAHIQSKLLQFIKERVALRVGGKRAFRADCRIIASTGKDLLKIVEDGQFREDLYYQLNTISLAIPSLRERGKDIELLACHFLNKGKSVEQQKSLSPGVIAQIHNYTWPGNIRELQNVIERASIFADGAIIEEVELENATGHGQQEEAKESEENYQFTEMTLDELEKKHICFTLTHLGGNKTKTAKTLGITVKTLYNKLHSYGMIGARE